MLTLSLITASYNRAHTIRDTIRSVNMQTYPAIDHIVIDGNSTDGSMDIVRAEAKRTGYVVSEPDKGFYDAYNKGLAVAKGDIIGFINTDDFYCSDDVIAQVMKVFEDNPTVEGVHADLVYVDPEDTSKIKRLWKARDFSRNDYRRGFIPAHPTVFVRREVYDRVGGYDTSYRLAADYDFLLRAFYVADIKAVHVPKIWIRMRTGGATGGAMNDIKRQNDEIRRAQQAHGIDYPEVLFYAHKAVDRTLQKMRAPFVSMPPEVTAA
jgi:glycosyltransferase involved in cell wall biosynthesis